MASSPASKIRLLQRLFLSFGVLFIVSLVAIIFYRSGERVSVVGASAGLDKREDTPVASDTPGQDGSQFQLREFHRIETKDGKTVWEVKARDAQFFTEEGVTHVNDASLVIYRSGNSAVRLQAKAAKLHLVGNSMERAELEGDIVVRLDDSLRLQADFATYDLEKEEMIVPGSVIIDGPGYVVTGKGLLFEIAKEEILLRENVSSRFNQGAKIPKDLAEIDQG